MQLIAMNASIAAAVFCLTAAPASAMAFDPGGSIMAYLDSVLAADMRGATIEIEGVCASACTMKLGARGACIHSDALLLFHAARNPDGVISELATRVMASMYPRKIQAWVERTGALTSLDLTPMSGTLAIRLGVPDCARKI